MTVNINFISPSSATAISETREIRASKIAPPDKLFVLLPQDNATISSVADLVIAALKQPEVRADRVSAIRGAIASGKYKFEPHATASLCALLADQA